MVPREFLLPYLLSNGIAAAILVLAFRRAPLARWAAVLVFVWASIVNTRTALTTPEVYLEYAALTMSDWYRAFITGWFSRHVVDLVLPIAAGQALIAVLLAVPRPWRLGGVAGAVLFLLAIAPLGVGSGFPFPLTFGLAILVADRRLHQASRQRLDDSPAARYFTGMDVHERHEVVVRAPAPLVFDTAVHVDVLSLPIVRAIFRARASLLGGVAPPPAWPDGLVAETRSIGWRELESEPGRLIVMGAVTEPWRANVVFRGLPADAFARFDEPGMVRIAWTLQADPMSPTRTRLRTDTIVEATDAAARRRFRRYWLFAGVGIVAIRLFLLPAIRRAAEHRFREATAGGDATVHPTNP